MSGWSTESADGFKSDLVRAERLKEARERLGPCPNCGAEADVDMINVSMPDRVDFVAGRAECSAMCWRADPDGYLMAVRNLSR